MILVDPYNPRANELYSKIASILNDLPITVVIGGDGWMLQCLREHSSEQPFLGLNAGTLGFLMNDIHQKESAIEDIKNQNWNVFSFSGMDRKWR